jgi:hypothetical protein
VQVQCSRSAAVEATQLDFRNEQGAHSKSLLLLQLKQLKQLTPTSDKR